MAKNYGKLTVMLEHKTSGTRLPMEHPDLGGNTLDAVRWAREQPEIQGFAYVVTRDMARVSVVSTMTNTATVESMGGDGNGDDEPDLEPAPQPKPQEAPKKAKGTRTPKALPAEPKAPEPPATAPEEPAVEPSDNDATPAAALPPDSPF